MGDFEETLCSKCKLSVKTIRYLRAELEAARATIAEMSDAAARTRRRGVREAAKRFWND